MDTPNNPPAFPQTCADMLDVGMVHEGMMLRDWFAGQCDVTAYEPLTSYKRARGVDPSIAQLADYIAQIRLIEADAMLAARSVQS